MAISTALLLIDIQNDYFPGGRMELAGAEEAARRAGELLERFRSAGRPVFHIRHVSLRPGATFFLPDTAGVEIHPLVQPQPGEQLITKHFPNSFRETDLLARLQGAAVDHLLVAGMMTHMCVDATVRASWDLGFECTVAQDACATRDLVFEDALIPAAQVHGAFLAALRGTYAAVREAASCGVE